jgi:hypothetical protein
VRVRGHANDRTSENWGGRATFTSRKRNGTEVNDGRGPADFKIARGAGDKTIVKLAKNSHLKRNLEAGCTTELDHTEQTSWLLFLKYLDGLEEVRGRSRVSVALGSAATEAKRT